MVGHYICRIVERVPSKWTSTLRTNPCLATVAMSKSQTSQQARLLQVFMLCVLIVVYTGERGGGHPSFASQVEKNRHAQVHPKSSLEHHETVCAKQAHHVLESVHSPTQVFGPQKRKCEQVRGRSGVALGNYVAAIFQVQPQHRTAVASTVRSTTALSRSSSTAKAW